MGVELFITRADFWAENDSNRIEAEEWLDYVASDPDLELSPENGEYFVIWNGDSEHEIPWLDWLDGNVFTKWPDTALYQKMLLVAGEMSATVQDEEGTLYEKKADWQFSPNEPSSESSIAIKPWWKFW